jgi:hypothetical protein
VAVVRLLYQTFGAVAKLPWQKGVLEFAWFEVRPLLIFFWSFFFSSAII